MNDKRKLVLVLDNLDRVPTTTARTLWATLRVFAECCEKKCNATWARRVWFIVPYDPTAARRLWDDGEEKKSSGPNPSGHSNDKEPENDGRKPTRSIAPRLSAAFLDKTFQIRFDVPPLLLADWKAYLGELLNRALKQASSDPGVVHRVYLLSRRLAQEKRRPPTPRHLKLFVNDIGALYRRFQGAFPVDHLALYAILRRQGHDVRLWLLEQSEEHDRFASVLGDTDFIASLCAMAHGTTDIEKARDLHLRSPIEAALASGSADDLDKLSATPGFWPVLEIICDQPVSEFGTDEPQVLGALKAVEKSTLLSDSRPECAALKKFLRQLVSDAEWKSLNNATGEGAACAIRLNLGQETSVSLLNRLASARDSEDIDKVDITDWIAGMQHMANALNATGLANASQGGVSLAVAEITKGILAEIAALDEPLRTQITQLINLTGNVAELVTELLPEPTTEWTDNHSRALRTLLNVPNTDIEFKAVLNAIQARFKVDQELNKQELDLLVGTLAEIEHLGESLALDQIQSIATDGTLFRRIHNCRKALNSTTVGHLFRWIIRFHDFGSAPTAPTSAPEGYQLAKKIGDNPKDYAVVVDCIVTHCQKQDANDLLHSVLQEVRNAKPLVATVLNQLRSNGKVGSVLHGPLFASSIAELEELCKLGDVPEIDELCRELLADDAFVNSLKSVDLKEDELEGATYLVKNGAMSHSSEYAKCVDEFLNGRTIDQWKHSLQSTDRVSELLVAVSTENDQFVLAGHFVEAFEQLLSDVLDGAISIKKAPDLWDEMCQVIPSNQQDTIASRVIEKGDAPDKHLVIVVPLFADHLQQAAAAYSEESFVRNALLPLLRSRDAGALEWMSRVVAGKPQCWTNAPTPDRETFSQELNSAFREADEELKACLQRIANDLEIVIDEAVDDENEADS